MTANDFADEQCRVTRHTLAVSSSCLLLSPPVCLISIHLLSPVLKCLRGVWTVQIVYRGWTCGEAARASIVDVGLATMSWHYHPKQPDLPYPSISLIIDQ